MNAQSYAFKLGQIDCTVLLDEVRWIGKDSVLRRFPDGNEAEYRQAYADMGLSLDEAADTFNILLAKHGTETVLVDAGEGGRPHGGHLLASMRQANLAPEAVTQLIITHSHGDHVLGLFNDDQQPAFPNASYVISGEELAFWQGRMDGGLEAQRPILAMMQAKGLRVIAMDEQILPWLRALPIPGHTPGQIALLLESDDARLIHMADLLHSPMQFAHPAWSPRFDLDPGLSVPTRREALGRAADDDLLALFYHLTFPGLGRVRRTDQAFTWEPLGTSP